MKRENTTVFTTKSGTKVYVVGTYKDKKLRDKIGGFFVRRFNDNFTEAEQRKIGNVYYDVYNKDNNATQTPSPKMDKADWIAQTGTFTGSDARRLNPGYRKMVDISFRADARDDEGAITHEMIHAKKFMNNIKGKYHNERMIDFEMVGRISERGINDLSNGYYFHPDGNAALRRQRISLEKKGDIAKQGACDDKVLLTGSVKKQMVGKPVEKKANKLFRKSFFNKKDLSSIKPCL